MLFLKQAASCGVPPWSPGQDSGGHTSKWSWGRAGDVGAGGGRKTGVNFSLLLTVLWAKAQQHSSSLKCIELCSHQGLPVFSPTSTSRDTRGAQEAPTRGQAGSPSGRGGSQESIPVLVPALFDSLGKAIPAGRIPWPDARLLCNALRPPLVT